MRLSDLQDKDIINITDGKRIGSIIDVLISENGEMVSFIVDSGRFFSKFSSHGEIEVKWSDVKKIGDDVILVSIKDL